MLKIKSFTFNPYQENTYLIFDDSKEAVIIDPGNYEAYENESISKFIDENKLQLKKIILTHCHLDHCLGNKYLNQKYGAELLIPFDERDLYKNVENIATLFGFANYSHLDENKYLKEKDKIEFGNIKLDVLFLPGHSPGHLAFYCKKENICFSGDVLFYNSIGRTDLPGGDHNTLINSIKNKLFLLNPDTIIYSGHGQKTILKNEMKNNPFLI
ncbi:MAG: MBL fold hydrolase [Legionellales bacterium]|nr:MBL fold hydrolase [Legionellales bacterium]